MFPLKAAFPPKDSSRWFAFNSRLQGAMPSSRLGCRKGLGGMGCRTGAMHRATRIHRGPRPCAMCTPFPVQTSKTRHPLVEPTPPQPDPPFPHPLPGKSLGQRGLGSALSCANSSGEKKRPEEPVGKREPVRSRTGRCERFEKPDCCFSTTRFGENEAEV